jgi:hypothetical protein
MRDIRRDGKPTLRLLVDRFVPSRRTSAVEVHLPRMERACDIALGVQVVIEAAASGRSRSNRPGPPGRAPPRGEKVDSPECR